MSGHMHLQTILIPCSEIAMAALQGRITHVLAPDVGPQSLCAAAYPLADSACLFALPDSAQDSWCIVLFVFFTCIHIECSQEIYQVVVLLQQVPLQLAMSTSTGSFFCQTGRWSAGPGSWSVHWYGDLRPHPGTYPAVLIIFTPIREDFWILRGQSVSSMELQRCHGLNIYLLDDIPSIIFYISLFN